jgi:hypothetical protein
MTSWAPFLRVLARTALWLAGRSEIATLTCALAALVMTAFGTDERSILSRGGLPMLRGGPDTRQISTFTPAVEVPDVLWCGSPPRGAGPRLAVQRLVPDMPREVSLVTIGGCATRAPPDGPAHVT